MVTFVKFSVLFNGKKLEEFRPTRKIRQGDPILPYLFLMAAEGLSCLLKSQNRPSHISEMKVEEPAPPVSHLLFADDNLLFVKAEGEGATLVTSLLDTYC